MWVITIVGSLGVAGTIAAAILFPAVVIPILQAVTRAILNCKPCLIALAIFASLFAGALYGAHVEKAKCRAGQLAAELRNKQIDVANAEKAKADETNRANQIEAESSTRHQSDLADIAKLKSRPPTCAFDDFDVGGGVAVGVPDKQHPGARKTKPAAGAR
jgi:hypothetical protein